MSNNKQSSVEWLYNKMYEHRGNITIEEFEQAKEMHKEEIRVAYMEGSFAKMRHFDGQEFIMPTEYYNETFNNDGNTNSN